MLSGIDIFSGAGGLSLGAELAGISIKCAIEINPSAAKTFKRNHKNAIVLNQDIRTISKNDFDFDTDEVFIIMGGMPRLFSFQYSFTHNEEPEQYAF